MPTWRLSFERLKKLGQEDLVAFAKNFVLHSKINQIEAILSSRIKQFSKTIPQKRWS
jgi:hypothetical protein